MEKHLIESMKSSFDSIMHVDEDGVEFWYHFTDVSKMVKNEKNFNHMIS